MNAKLIHRKFKQRHLKICWILTKLMRLAITVFIRLVEHLSVLEWAYAWDWINDVCWCICQITNQCLDKGRMCASLCISLTYCPPRLHKTSISRNVRIVGSAVVTSWQPVRGNNKASAPVSSWLHQQCNTRLRINDTHSSPVSRLLSLQTINADKKRIYLKKKH